MIHERGICNFLSQKFVLCFARFKELQFANHVSKRVYIFILNKKELEIAFVLSQKISCKSMWIKLL